MPPDLTSRTRFPTQVGYSLIGGGVGMLMACQLFALHDIDVPDTSLFGYGCHEEESKPIMRGMLHTVAAVVCFLTMILQYLAVGSTRHPSDFVMAYFGMQYLASAIYHRQRWSATIVSTFTIVDMGWIAFTILGSSYMMKLKKVRGRGRGRGRWRGRWRERQLGDGLTRRACWSAAWRDGSNRRLNYSFISR